MSLIAGLVPIGSSQPTRGAMTVTQTAGSDGSPVSRTLDRNTLLAGTGTMSGITTLSFAATYTDSPPAVVTPGGTTLYFSINGANPVPGVNTQSKTLSAGTAGQQDATKTFTTTWTDADLASSVLQVRFIIQLTQAATGANYCDYGYTMVSGACAGAPAGAPTEYGYSFNLDSTRPVVTTGLAVNSAARKFTYSTASHDVTITDDQNAGVRVRIVDSVDSILDTATSVDVRANNSITPGQAVTRTTNTPYDFVYDFDPPSGWGAIGGDFRNQDLVVAIDARDLGGNRPVAFKRTLLHVDTNAPDILGTRNTESIPPLPPPAGETAPAITLTPPSPHPDVAVGGLGSQISILFNINDNTLNKASANATGTTPAAQVVLYNLTNSFFTAPLVTRFVSGTQWRADGVIVGASGSSTPTGRFNLTARFKALDVIGNNKSEVLQNKIRIDPGPPTFTVATNFSVMTGTGATPRVISKGPLGQVHIFENGFAPKLAGTDQTYKMNITGIDADGIRNGTLAVRISAKTGHFWWTDAQFTAAGWTKINAKTWEFRTSADGAGIAAKGRTRACNVNPPCGYPGLLPNTAVRTNYTVEIPHASDGSLIEYNITASDRIGNIGRSQNRTFTVDWTGPTILEPNNRTYRGMPPQNITFTAGDLGKNATKGAGVNRTTGKFYFRLGSTGAWNTQTVHANNSIFIARVEGASFGTHNGKVEYYLEALDVLGNLGSNGTAEKPRTYTIDSQAPTTTLDDLTATSDTGRVTLKAAASDPDSGVAQIVYEGAQRLRGTQTWGPWIQLASVAAGHHQVCLAGQMDYKFRAYAVDRVGNRGERSKEVGTSVPGAGCPQDIAISVQTPAPNAVLDAQGGAGRATIRYTAKPIIAFTNATLLDIRLEFSPDNGQTFVQIAGAEKLRNTGNFTWSLAVPSCEQCRLRVNATLPDGTGRNATSAPFEIINGSRVADLDASGLYDDCEVRAFGRLRHPQAGPDMDPDQDGLTNRRECEIGTDPMDSDSDNDGVDDGSEVKVRRNPMNPQDVPSGQELRYQEWGAYALVVPAIFLAVIVVFLLGLARRW